ncbi:MAG: Na+/H+ antiporter subunit E [Chloroflexota bacterium]
MYYLRLAFPLTIIYLMATNNIELSNIVVGLLLSLAIAVLVRPRMQEINWQDLPTMLLATIQYVGVLIWDVSLNGLKVARIVLTPGKMPISPGIIAVPSLCQTEWGTALSAFAITAAPGEMVIEISDDGIMYTHCLIATNKEKYIAQAQQRRRDMLQRIFA